ncbi:MAG TPA: 50S ribosomal protein L9 [Opitutae bacterium]|mgnify:CR=1 FL=1|nr:50S ribosomal protein L9 [Opitutae bacterium]|tara:strand:+ start:217 stop:699 length:483 start_codon:yes stop_codon:yes gene_type:complete
MAYSNVLLIKQVNGLGGEGDEVRVKAGYARNYLWPKKFAIPVNRANRKQIEALQVARARREAEEREHAEALEGKLKQVSVAIAVKTGEGGKMFGSVTAQDLLDRLKEDGIELDKKQLALYTPIKSLGKHSTRIKLHADITFELEFEVVSENPIEQAAEEA